MRVTHDRSDVEPLPTTARWRCFGDCEPLGHASLSVGVIRSTDTGSASVAQQTTVAYVDDLDNDLAAEETLPFVLDGVSYEIDLTRPTRPRCETTSPRGCLTPAVPGAGPPHPPPAPAPPPVEPSPTESRPPPSGPGPAATATPCPTAAESPRPYRTRSIPPTDPSRPVPAGSSETADDWLGVVLARPVCGRALLT